MIRSMRSAVATMVAAAILAIGLAGAAIAQTSNLPSPSAGAHPPATAQPDNGDATPAPVVGGMPNTGTPDTGSDENYRLGTGDKLKVTVYGEDDLSGEVAVDGSGQVQLPLVGPMKAGGLTVHEFVAEVQQILGAKYLKDPRVSVEIKSYRPFYIMGEVNKPGEYPYDLANIPMKTA